MRTISLKIIHRLPAMAYDQQTPKFDINQRGRMRAYQCPNESCSGYRDEVISKGVLGDQIESCLSGLPQNEDCLVSPGPGAAGSYRIREGLQIPTRAPLTPGQTHGDISEDSLNDVFDVLHTPRSNSEPTSPPHSRALSDSSRSFRCEHCSKSFTRLYNLKSHLVVHARTMPFSCDICSRAFARKSDAKRHMRTHSGEKNWVCGGCRMSFSRKDMLTSHLKTRKGQACLEYQQTKSAEGSERSVSEGVQSPRILSISSLLS